MILHKGVLAAQVCHDQDSKESPTLLADEIWKYRRSIIVHVSYSFPSIEIRYTKYALCVSHTRIKNVHTKYMYYQVMVRWSVSWSVIWSH